MTNSRWLFWLMGLVVLALAMPTWAEDEEEKSVLDNDTLDSHIAGPEATADSVRGKVVLFVYWDSGASSAVENLQTLGRLKNKYDDTDRFAIIVSHSGPNLDNAMKMCRENAVTFPVYHQQDIMGRSATRAGNSSFYGYLYNYDATFADDGNVKSLLDDIDDLMEDVPLRSTVMTEDVEILHNKDLAKDLVPGNPIKRILSGLERRAKGSDEAQAAEAQAILDSVNAWIEAELLDIAGQIETEPAHAFIRLSIMDQTLKGMDEADQVDELADPLKEDDNIEDLAELIVKMDKLQEMADTHGPTRQVANNCRSADKALERFLKRDDLTDALRAEAEGVVAWLEEIEAKMEAQEEACR